MPLCAAGVDVVVVQALADEYKISDAEVDC